MQPELATVQPTLDRILNERPVYAQLVESFGPLLAAQERLAARLSSQGIPLPEADPARLAQGAPILAGTDLAPWADLLLECAAELRPLIEAILPDGLRAALPETVFTDADELCELARARLHGDREARPNTSGDDARLLSALVAELVLSPLLHAVSASLGELAPTEGWAHGNCPVCGSLPSLGCLSQRENHDLEHLVGGGGKKYLHCSLCGHDWHHRRDACPACGNNDQQTREIFYAEDKRSERVEACNACGTYLLCIDLRDFDQLPNLDALQLGLVHLDLTARDKSFAPMTRTLWNGVES
jgi:FdhE protein